MKSLRSRLLLWYSLSLSVVIVVYAGTVTYLYRQSLIRALDADLFAESGVIASALTLDIDGTFDLNIPPAVREASATDPSTRTYYAVWNAQGQLVDQSDAAVTPPRVPALGASTRAGQREVVVDGRGAARVLVGRRLDTIGAAVNGLGLTVAGVGLIVLVVSLGGGFVLAGRALAPVARIGQTASAMIEGDLNARIPVQGTASELEHVARALNEAFDRMRLSADHQRQFTADASHELRTPLATLRAEFEWALSRPREVAEYKASIEKGLKAVERMTDLSGRLLALARPDGAYDLQRTNVDVSTVVHSGVALLSSLAVAHQVSVETECEPCWVVGVPSLLADAFSNLLKNAIEYSRPGDAVSIRVGKEKGWVALTVRDTGVGIAAEDLPRIFERFYRADRSRTRGGAGLGLAIVKSIVEDHGGSVRCTSAPGEGTEFVVRLPLVTPSPAASV